METGAAHGHHGPHWSALEVNMVMIRTLYGAYQKAPLTDEEVEPSTCGVLS
jgi:hypothetical protein